MSTFDLPDLLTELQFQTSRSSGAGGQNVNKVETKVEVRFNIVDSQLLPDDIKEKLLLRLASKLTFDNELIVTSQESRSQLKNKELAIKKIYQLLRKALKEPKKRKPTKPSKTAIEDRLKSKKNTSEKKASRGKVDF